MVKKLTIADLILSAYLNFSLLGYSCIGWHLINKTCRTNYTWISTFFSLFLFQKINGVFCTLTIQLVFVLNLSFLYKTALLNWFSTFDHYLVLFILFLLLNLLSVQITVAFLYTRHLLVCVRVCCLCVCVLYCVLGMLLCVCVYHRACAFWFETWLFISILFYFTEKCKKITYLID